MWRRWAAVACLLAALLAPHAGVARAASACAPVVRATLHLPGRVDSILPVAPGGAAVALVAASPSGVPFLPHDDLLVLAPDGHVRARVALPSYEIPPGLTSDGRGAVYAVVDTTLLAIDAAKGRIAARWPLGVQALGWPAAITAGPHGRLYVAGQPETGRAAVLDALTVPPTPQGRPTVAWRASLGLTHAGIWLGLAGHGLVAAYLPNADDVHGAIALFDERTGSLRASYAVPVSPAGVDAAHDRLYLDDAGTLRAVSLRGGAAVASVPGEGPFALSASRGLLAFVRGRVVVLASARTLHPLTRVPVSDAFALAFTPDGSALLVGQRNGLTRVDVAGCGGA